MPKDDVVRLRHMLDAACEALAFVHGKERRDLDRDRMLVLALVRCVEIIGEAASHVTAGTQARHSSVPWADIVGMRNRLVHAYYDVDLNRVWDTIKDDLPPLVTELKRIVSDQSTPA